MKKIWISAIVLLCMLLATAATAWADYSHPPVWVHLDVTVGGNDDYETYCETPRESPRATVAMYSKTATAFYECYDEQGWAFLGIQANRTRVAHKWSDIGQSALEPGGYGCVAGCVWLYDRYPPIRSCWHSFDPLDS